MSVSSDEVNLLVYRYLLESGFGHSAFTFANESGVAKSPLANSDVPQGSLITLLQKGLQYVEVETHITDKGESVQCTQPFSIVSKHKCSSKKRKATLNDSAVLDAANDDDNDDDVPEWDSNEVVKLEGHDNEVFVCAWHPSADLIATGSGDATARLWHVPRNVSTQQAASTAISTVKVLRHVSAGNTNKSRDVTTLDWNRHGLLATASYDGVARIWKQDGELVKELVGHKGPIFALKWNKSGTHLLSGSFDKSAVIWDAATGALRQQFAFHTAPTLDVDWRSDSSFASCSTDKHILVCELGRNAPLNDFVGHSDEVNAITWDATGRLLASCSDDRTAKLWNCDSPVAVATLSEHAKEIYTIEWAPTGAGTANPSARPLLASASFDATIKLWDPESQQCVRTLAKHTDPVYSVSFSPDGQYLASGSLDKCVNIWSVRDGTLLRRYRGGGGIFEVRWNAAGDRLGACFADKSVVVIDMRKL